MKRKCFNVFLSSLGAFLSVSWILGIKNNEPSWAESLLFFTITLLYLRKYDDRRMIVPVVLSVIGGRIIFEVVLDILELVYTGTLEPVYSWFFTFMSVAGTLAGAIYYRWQRPYVLVAIVMAAIGLIVCVQPLWLNFVM